MEIDELRKNLDEITLEFERKKLTIFNSWASAINNNFNKCAEIKFRYNDEFKDTLDVDIKYNNKVEINSSEMFGLIYLVNALVKPNYRNYNALYSYKYIVNFTTHFEPKIETLVYKVPVDKMIVLIKEINENISDFIDSQKKMMESFNSELNLNWFKNLMNDCTDLFKKNKLKEELPNLFSYYDNSLKQINTPSIRMSLSLNNKLFAKMYLYAIANGYSGMYGFQNKTTSCIMEMFNELSLIISINPDTIRLPRC